MEDVDFGKRVKKVGTVLLEKRCWSVTSSRRFEKGGHIKWNLIWCFSGIWYFLTGRSPLRFYKTVR